MLRTNDRFMISSHINPDGDAIGSSLAVKRMLEKLGKDVLWVLDEDPDMRFTDFINRKNSTCWGKTV